MRQSDSYLSDKLSGLISRDLLGLLDEKEKQNLEELLKEYRLPTPDRDLIVECLSKAPEFSSEKACREFFAGIRPQRHYLRRLARVAAVITLLLGAGLLFYPWSEKSIPVAEIQQNKTVIQPGESRAVITLANGERVEMGKETKELVEKNGTRLTMDGGKLVYQPNDKKAALIYNTLEIPRGGEYCLTLSDGTRVWLNAQSELKYPVCFSGEKREVFLKGEAYFEVVRNEQKPFEVNTSRGNIRVLGTEFNIRDYKEEMRVVTTLVNGSVAYTSVKNKMVALHPSEQLEDRGDNSLIPQKVNTALYVGWKDGKYLFKNLSLEEIMETLERWYDVTVFWQNENSRQLHFTGDLKRYDNINTLLKFIETGGDVRFEIKGKTIIVKEK